MTLGEFRKLTASLPDYFTIEISVTTGYSKSGIDMETLEEVSVDIGHSSEVVHFFGISPNAEFPCCGNTEDRDIHAANNMIYFYLNNDKFKVNNT